MLIVKKDTLPTVQLNGEVSAYIFDGTDHGTDVSAFIVDVRAGVGPKRHKHPYDEVFVVIDGTVRLEAGGELVEATPNEICVVPAGVPHAFSNVGPGDARMVNIHASPTVVTEFVEELTASTVVYEYNHRS